LAYKRIKLD